MPSNCGRGGRAYTFCTRNAAEGIPICFKPGGSQPSHSGVVKLVTAKSKTGQAGWRSYLQYYNDPAKTRVFGTWRETRLSAVNNLLAKFQADLTASEMSRVRRISGMPAVRMKPRGKSASSRVGSQPCVETTQVVDTQDEMDGKELEKPCVPFVHQIYGLFRDGKPMSDLFVESQRRWKQCAASMGVPYHCWTADEVDHLMSTYYKDYWDMYKNVRYPVMRCDIGRIAILHRFGGLYSDMDVLPNRFEYKHSELSVCSVPPGQKPDGTYQKGFLDMEVLIAAPGNPFLMDWLKHMKTQIERIDYSKGVYVNRRMRYIYHTTGPRGMEHFFKSGDNKEYAQAKIGHIQCNRFMDYSILTPSQKQEYDVLTQRSNSYFTSEFKVDKPVVESLENFAPFCITHSKRIRTKSSMHGAVVGGTGMASDLLPGSQPSLGENEASEDVQRMQTRSKRLEETLLSLWDHIRVKGQDRQWLHAFLEGMDNDKKMHTLSALVFMDEVDEQAHDNDKRVIGKDISFDNIVTAEASVAAWARNNYEDPLALLTHMAQLSTSTAKRHRVTNICRRGDT